MDCAQVEAALGSMNAVKAYFRGCVSVSDFEPFCRATFDPSSSRNIYVVLIGNKREFIGHFVLFYWISHGTGYRCLIADSFGFQVSSVGQKRLDRILDFTKTTSVQVTKTPVQDSGSCMCGAWVIAFVIWLSNGYSLKQIEHFLEGRDPKINDIALYRFLKDNFGFFNRNQLIDCKLLDY